MNLAPVDRGALCWIAAMVVTALLATGYLALLGQNLGGL
jgi:hypothetical protein